MSILSYCRIIFTSSGNQATRVLSEHHGSIYSKILPDNIPRTNSRHINQTKPENNLSLGSATGVTTCTLPVNPRSNTDAPSNGDPEARTNEHNTLIPPLSRNQTPNSASRSFPLGAGDHTYLTSPTEKEAPNIGDIIHQTRRLLATGDERQVNVFCMRFTPL